MHPYKNKVFLPTFVNMYDVQIAAITCSELINIGKINLYDGKSSAII